MILLLIWGWMEMELFQLRYAVTVLEYCNFSRAAEKLFITQPTLSQQIHRLEQELGFSLFSRNSRHVVPTAEGEHFLKSAVKVLQEFENLQREVQSIQNRLEYKITFGTSPFSSPFISGAIPLFMEDFPKVSLTLYEASDEELIDLVVKNELDLAIVSLPQNHPQREMLRVIPITEEYVCTVVSKDHPLAAQPAVTLEELLPYRLAFSSPKSGLRKIIFDEFETQKLAPPQTIELASIDARMELILNGAVGLTLSGQKTWHTQKNIIRIPVSPRIYATFSIILSKKTKISAALKDLIQIVAVKKIGQKVFRADQLDRIST